MPIKNALAGVAVRNLEAAIAWYGDLLGRPPDNRPMDNLAEWSFTGGSWLQLFHDEARAGRSSVTFAEADVGGRLEALKRSGVRIESSDVSGPFKLAIASDPDGNRIVFAQSSPGDERHRATA